MARTDLVLDLIKASVRGDPLHVRASAEAIAADERAKKHTGVADRIFKVLDTTRAINGHQKPSPRTHDGSGGIMRSEPTRRLSTLFLEEHVRESCDELIEEQRRADVLRAHGLEPKHRVILSGPPGNGKTTLAEALAYELALPLFTVRYESVVTSYLGETAQRLKRLFDYVRTEPCVLFFDEFDAIGKERGDIHETGEIKRVVTTLLMQLDMLPSYCLLVCATNHPELLDRAAWRRFELRLNLDVPSKKQLLAYFSNNLNQLIGQPGYTAKRLCEAISPSSFSEAEGFFLDLQRRIVLDQGQRELRAILDERVKSHHSRRFLVPGENIDGRSSNTEVS